MQRSFVALAMVAVVCAAVGAQQPEQAIDGRWSGSVSTDAGQMAIEVTLRVNDGQASGSIATGHGELVIKGGSFADGRWTLPFAGHGMQGRMVAAVKGDTLSGDWVNPGIAEGTFSLTRAK